MLYKITEGGQICPGVPSGRAPLICFQPRVHCDWRWPVADLSSTTPLPDSSTFFISFACAPLVDISASILFRGGDYEGIYLAIKSPILIHFSRLPSAWPRFIGGRALWSPNSNHKVKCGGLPACLLVGDLFIVRPSPMYATQIDSLQVASIPSSSPVSLL